MFFILSKILAIAVKPLTWIILLFIIGLFTKREKLKKWSLYSSLALLVFFSNQYISNRVMLAWEPTPVPINELEYHDVAVVFSGVTRGSKTPRDRVYFQDGADRITHTMQLYKEGKIGHIIVSGGLGFQQVSNSAAADRLRSFLLTAGVPDSVITVEPDAKNTFENAVKATTLLKNNFPNQKYLLITSAFHMKRASLCMEKQGLDFDTFPAGYKTGRPTTNFNDLFVPSSASFGRWETLFKEWVGIVTYKVMGYI